MGFSRCFNKLRTNGKLFLSGTELAVYHMFRLFKILLVIAAIASVWGCERDYMFRGGSEGLYFSSDTVMFDTIFTSIGSTTKHFRVYNPYSSDLTIDAITLAGGDNSKFRLNINGFPENSLRDMPMRAGDSIFIFVELTIDPSGTSTPFVVTDSILFYTRERVQSVKLIAYGQDVVLLRKEWLKTQRFTKQKPYLIYDYVVVDSTETLTIEAGARLHFHKNASLIVLGSLEVKGTKEEPVTFMGSRLEEWYADKPGQWGYIHLMPGSKNHSIEYAHIKNGTMGIVVDSVGINETEPVYLSNTRIEHIAKQGLLAQTSAIVANNCIFGDCGSASVALTVGGKYEFYHCTIANYFRWAYRSAPALLLSNYYTDKEGVPRTKDLESALFANCIIYGRAENEIVLDFRRPKGGGLDVVINYRFDHSLIRSAAKSDALANTTFYRNVIVNKDPKFIAPFDFNFQLDTLSVAKDAGDVAIGRRFPKDISGNSRIDDGGPDLGAYERKEKQ